MPIKLIGAHKLDVAKDFEKVFQFFEKVDRLYSPYIQDSDVSKINRSELLSENYSLELKEILNYAEQTRLETNGFFNVWHNQVFDPSGIVKAWAIQKASEMMSEGVTDFYIDAGGDIQTKGRNDAMQPWHIGIRNPFNRAENVSVIALEDYAVATSGTTIRGQHIYNPVSGTLDTDVVSLSVIAPTILDADRMATAAFAMGKDGIEFIEKLSGYEAYQINKNKQATMTTGWHSFELSAE